MRARNPAPTGDPFAITSAHSLVVPLSALGGGAGAIAGVYPAALSGGRWRRIPRPGEVRRTRRRRPAYLPSMSAHYSQQRETPANAPAAAAAQLGDKLPERPATLAERVRASLILCPPR